MRFRPEKQSEKLTAIISLDAVETRLQLVAALALVADAIVKAADITGNVSCSCHSGERQEERVAKVSHVGDWSLAC